MKRLMIGWMLALLLAATPNSPSGWRRLSVGVPGKITAIVLADEDGDGRTDLVIAHGTGGGRRIAVLRQTAEGFPSTPQETWPLPEGAMALIVEDLRKGDGAEVATIHRDGIYLHKRRPGEETRSFHLWAPVESFFSFAADEGPGRWDLAGDLDGDSLAEVIVPTEGGYRILDANPEGQPVGPLLHVPTWTEIDPLMPSRVRGHLFTFRSTLPRLNLRDLDGDGRMDLVYLHGDGVMGFSKSADGTFPSRPNIVEELLPLQKLGAGSIGRARTRLADLTGDGVVDLLVTRNIGKVGLFETLRTHLSVFVGSGSGGFPTKPSQVILIKGVSIEPRLVDFDGDGDLDLFVSALRTDLFTNVKRVVIRSVRITYYGYLNGDDGRFPISPSLSWDVKIPVESIEQGKTVPMAWFEGDFNGDGIHDVLSVGGAKTIAAYPGTRDGDEFEFGDDAIFEISGAASDKVQIEDLTGDGLADVVMQLSEGGGIVLILSPGKGGM